MGERKLTTIMFEDMPDTKPPLSKPFVQSPGNCAEPFCIVVPKYSVGKKPCTAASHDPNSTGEISQIGPVDGGAHWPYVSFALVKVMMGNGASWLVKADWLITLDQVASSGPGGMLGPPIKSYAMPWP